MKKGDITQIAEYDAVSALDMYVRNGQWEECLNLAEKQVSSSDSSSFSVYHFTNRHLTITAIKKNENVLNKYVAKYSSLLIPNGQIDTALDLFKRYGTPAIPQVSSKNLGEK